jgi:hypothetical protein
MKFDGSIVDDGIWPTIDFKIKGETNFFAVILKVKHIATRKGFRVNVHDPQYLFKEIQPRNFFFMIDMEISRLLLSQARTDVTMQATVPAPK